MKYKMTDGGVYPHDVTRYVRRMMSRRCHGTMTGLVTRCCPDRVLETTAASLPLAYITDSIKHCPGGARPTL